MNTIYYLNDDNKLTEAQDEEASILINDPMDVINYAVSFIYENGDIEQVLRNANSKSHALLLKKLYEKSKKLKKYLLEKQIDELEHARADINLAKKNVMGLYYYFSMSAYHNMHIGYLNIPKNLTDKQKLFLNDRLSYFEQYDFLEINQYNKNTQTLDELTEHGQNFMRVLRNLVQK